MLTCIYHPIDPMRVVEQEEAEKMRATGVWFDCPSKARKYRADVEEEIKQETEVAEKRIKNKFKGK
jgi:hypothetical protein